MATEPEPSADADRRPKAVNLDRAFRFGAYRREGRGLEFDRVANFCDAVYAIAMTLIAATIAVPSVVEASDEAELVEHLQDSIPNIIMFFIAFLVIGRYWMANHYFVGLLRAVDARFTVLVLVYLAFVAFLPFPSALMGRFSENAVAVSMFAVTVAAVSLMETVLLWRAHKDDLFADPLTDESARWNVIGSVSPVFFFVASVPVMFVSTWLGMAVWALSWPLSVVIDRMRPEDVAD